MIKKRCYDFKNFVRVYKWTPYPHQIESLLSGKKENVVVATGTGSGKRMFLYPMLGQMVQKPMKGKMMQRGAKALILYPMNALVADQQ